MKTSLDNMIFARFCPEKEMVVTNTFFKLPKRRLYTWKFLSTQPERIVCNQIDYITINKRFRNIIKLVKPGADVPTDHTLLLALIRLRFKRVSQRQTHRRKLNSGKLKTIQYMEEIDFC